MATLNPSNITTGNTILASDILQLYEAFGTGSQNITGLSMTGSITNATTAATASSATNLVVASTASGVYYPIVVDGTGTKPPKTVSTFELSGSVLNNITASRAITSSFSLNSNATQINGQSYDGGSGVVSGDFKFIAGKTAITAGSATSSVFPVLAGKTLGTNAFITANYALTSGPTDAVIVTSISSSGAILFDNNSPGVPTGTVIFTGIYI